jgi:hypothetical protein
MSGRPLGQVTPERRRRSPTNGLQVRRSQRVAHPTASDEAPHHRVRDGRQRLSTWFRRLTGPRTGGSRKRSCRPGRMVHGRPTLPAVCVMLVNWRSRTRHHRQRRARLLAPRGTITALRRGRVRRASCRGFGGRRRRRIVGLGGRAPASRRGRGLRCRPRRGCGCGCGRRRRLRRSGRQQGQRIDIRVGVTDAHSEVQVGRRVLGIARRPGLRDRRTLHDVRALAYQQRAEMSQRCLVAIARRNRHREPLPRDRSRKRDRARTRGTNLLRPNDADVDSSVLARRVGVGAHREAAQDRTV